MCEHDDAGVHITATLFSDVYTVREPTLASKFDWLVGVIVNDDAAARCVSRMATLLLTAVMEAFLR